MSDVFGWMAAGGPFTGNPAAREAREQAVDSLDRTVLPIPLTEALIPGLDPMALSSCWCKAHRPDSPRREIAKRS